MTVRGDSRPWLVVEINTVTLKNTFLMHDYRIVRVDLSGETVEIWRAGRGLTRHNAEV